MDRYLLLAGPTAANLQQRLSGSRPMQGQTDGRTDTATLHRPCAAYCVRSVSKYIVIYKRPRWSAATQQNAEHTRRLYILCWSELSRRKLSPTLATPTTLVLTTLVAQCELSRRKIGLLLEVVGRKFSHRPGNPAAVGVVRWPADGDTAGSSLRRLSSLQHRIYNLLGSTKLDHHTHRGHGRQRRPIHRRVVHGLGWVGSRFFSFWWVGLGPLQEKY